MSRDLSGFTHAGYSRGRPVHVQISWLVVQNLLFKRWWVPKGARVRMLRAFGANVGDGVLIRHGVRVHWPWKLSIGDHSWIGDGVWILNLEPVSIGANVCVSQDVLLCTGSHDRRSPTFEFDNGPIVVEDEVWLAVRSTVLRGVRVGKGAVVGATALVTTDVAPGAEVLAPRACVRQHDTASSG